MRSPRRALLTFSLPVVVLAGCGGGQDVVDGPGLTKDSPISESVDFASLHENHTPYIGDNSRVIALVDATGPEAIGELTLALETDQRPYGLVLDFSSVEPDITADVADGLLTDRAALLLATIDNADEVRWELPEHAGQAGSGSLTRAQADALVGSPVADLGTSAEGLEELAELLEGN